MAREWIPPEVSKPAIAGADVGAVVPERVLLTRAAYVRIRAELEEARDVLRPALQRRMRRLQLFGDPGRGTQLVDELQGHLTTLDERIDEFTATIARAEAIGEGATPTTVQLGTAATVRYEDGTEETLTLVGPLEADPDRGFVSIESVAGKALRGKPSGARVSIGEGADAIALTIGSLALPTAPEEAVQPVATGSGR